MTKLVEAINPNNGYLVTTTAAASQLNNDELTAYYQPLMSTVAFALIQVLRTELTSHPTLDQLHHHSRLLALLNVGINDLTAARNQLEALELVRTYQGTTGGEAFFVYELQPQLTPRQLLSDDLLSTLLLQNVGQEHFEELVDQAGQYQYDVDKLEDQTHAFFDVFQPDQAELGRDEQVLKDARDSLQTKAHERIIKTPTDGFNYGTLSQQLQQDGVSSDDLQKYRQLITTTHLMYGLDEVALRKLVLQAVDWGVKNRFQPRQFQLAVAVSFGSDPVQKQVQSSASSSASTSAKSESNQTASKLSSQEKQLVEVAKKLAPLQFLATLKQQTGGGFVTSNEKYIISNLVQLGMQTDVINILSYYVIVNQNLPTLRKNLVDTIANSWQRANIQTAEDALYEISQHQTKVQSNKSRGFQKRAGRRGQVKEKLPDWAKNDSDKKHHKATNAQVAESKKLLASLHRQQKK